jgi:hypothetical protein
MLKQARCALTAHCVAALLLSVSPLMSAAPAEAATYYVSVTGDDARPGTTIASAWRSMNRVNQQQLAPGDNVLFEGGRTFNGQLSLDRVDAGRSDLLVTIGSYGPNGRATIANAQGTAIQVYNTAGVRIVNLAVTGAGRDVNTGSGILFYNDLPGDLLLAGVYIEQVDVSGFGDYGIEIGGWNNRSGFRSVRIEGATVRENGLGGLLTYAFQRAVHRDVYVGSTRAFLNAGFSTLAGNSGSGIVLGGVDGGTIERSVAYGNGWRSTASEGPVGIWTYDSNRVVIQFNESYDNRTGGPADGGGFDLDSGTSNSILQYNYSHGNDGAGFMLAHGRADRIHAGNLVRYNVSQNDGRRNKYGGIHLWGRITSAEVHNNTIYMAATASAAPRGIEIGNRGVEANDPEHVHLRNNIVQTTGSVRVVSASLSALDRSVDVRLEGNLYWPSGVSFRVLWRDVLYDSLTSWRTATGQERVAGVDTGLTADPGLRAPGSGPTFGSGGLIGGLYHYRLTASSAAIDSGLDLTAFGVVPGPRDYFGGGSRRHLGYDVGAHEFGTDCPFTITPSSTSMPAGGASTQVTLWTAALDCTWAAVPAQPWLSVGLQAGGGPATITVRADPNPGALARTGKVAIADRTLTITQAAAAGTNPGRELVLWTVDAIVAGGWNRVTDSSAAGGVRLQSPDLGAAKLLTAAAAPAAYFELPFDALAGVPYRLWIRGKAAANSFANDSAFVQFDASVNGSGTPVYRIGTTDAAPFVLEECSGCGVSGWGWEDNGYGAGMLGPLIYFATTGTHRVRVQVREDGLGIDQIVLSSDLYLTSAPGAKKADTTILPKP